MVATEVLLLVQVPPVITSDKLVVDPGHTVVVPVMVPAVAAELTVIRAVALALPQIPETV